MGDGAMPAIMPQALTLPTRRCSRTLMLPYLDPGLGRQRHRLPPSTPGLSAQAGMVPGMDMGVVWPAVRPHGAVTAAGLVPARFADVARWNARAWPLPAGRW
jgi:hypothetical protein